MSVPVSGTFYVTAVVDGENAIEYRIKTNIAAIKMDPNNIQSVAASFNFVKANGSVETPLSAYPRLRIYDKAGSVLRDNKITSASTGYSYLIPQGSYGTASSLNITIYSDNTHTNQLATVTLNIVRETPRYAGIMGEWNAGLVLNNGNYILIDGVVYVWSNPIPGNSSVPPLNDIQKNPTTTSWKAYEYWPLIGTDFLLARRIKSEEIDVDNVIADGIFGKELDVQDAVISNLTVINATVTGTIYANSGTIGGFEIGSGRIGSVASADGSGGGLAIYSNFFRVGGGNGYVLFGDNVIPATAGGAFNATGRIVNQTYNRGAGWGFDACNTGLYINVSGGTKNFGIDSNAALKAPAFINTKVKYLVFGTTYSIDLAQYSMFMCYASSAKNVVMPDESSIARQFSLSSLPSDFGCIFTFHVIGGSSDITLENVIDWNTSSINLRLVQGDTVQLLVTKFPNFHYQIINHTN